MTYEGFAYRVKKRKKEKNKKALWKRLEHEVTGQTLRVAKKKSQHSCDTRIKATKE